MSEQPPQQPNNFDAQPPNGQPLQPLSPEALTQRTAEATLHKLEAEAKLVDVQLQQAQRYWFVPAFRAIGAGMILTFALFVLYQPVVDRAEKVAEREAKIAQLEAKRAALEAAIQSKEVKIQKGLNAELSAALQERQRQLKAQEERYGIELKKLAEDLKQNKKEKEAAIKLVKDLRRQLTNISEEYRVVAETSETEKEKYVGLAKVAEERVSRLTVELQALEEQARAAEKQATQVQKQVEKLPFRNSIGMEFVYIPAGKFMMGSTEGRTNERPVHQVTISQPFYLGRYEVTQGQWEAVMGRNPSTFTGDPNRPVEQVSWHDVREFIQKLNAKEGVTHYRLPTEAEWEYAARAGTTTAFHYGDTLDSTQANFDGNFPYGGAGKGPYLERTTAVGSYQANVFGLYDMHGNVWEWVQDWYGWDYYEQSSTRNPEGPASGASRVMRGGGWYGVARLCRAAIRYYGAPGYRVLNLGFRLARSVALGP